MVETVLVVIATIYYTLGIAHFSTALMEQRHHEAPRHADNHDPEGDNGEQPASGAQHEEV